MTRTAVLTLLLTLVPPLAAAQTSPAAAPALPATEQATVDVIDRALGSVLYITATVPSAQQGAFSSPLFGGSDEGNGGEGSGFFIDNQGYALTNYHVIEGATRLTVNLRGSRQDYAARVVGTAPDYDLALIQVQGVPANLIRPLSFGNSDALRVGQTTIALGAPFGFQFSATTGIVSAVERSVPIGVRQIAQNTIQTDAAVNPGNSGGPLLDSAGRVIGINTQIISPSGAATGIGQSAGVGFAVPANVAQRLLPQLRAGQTILGPVLGIVLTPFELTDLSEQARQQYRLPRTGALVSEVQPGGPAAAAGLRGGTASLRTPLGTAYLGGDVITAINGQPVESNADLRAYLFGRQAGERVTLTVNRAGQTLTLSATLAPGSAPGSGGR